MGITATYVYFLLFAQFGFLHQAQQLVPDVRPAMAAMGLSGLVVSFLTARILARRSLLRAGYLACAGTAIFSLFARTPATLPIAAALIGASTAILTVSLAAELRAWMGGANLGLRVGWATGLAYFICNIPALFEGPAWLQAGFPAALCLACAFLPQPGRRAEEPSSGATRHVLGFVLMFLALVALDSAAFAIIQQTRGLKDVTWQTPGQKLFMGAVHFLAAVAAGRLIDRHGLRVVLWSALALFAVALPVANGPLYAVGISFYSVGLVVFPSLGSIPGQWPARWRSALAYGIAGWLGSALGVGLAQHVHRIALLPVGVAAALVATGTWLTRRTAAAATLLVLLFARPLFADGAVARGRAVYIAEGCIHCHSQYIRPGTPDELMWGPWRAVDFTEKPPMLGNRRQGPDLLNVGNRRSAQWQALHLRNPQAVSPGSKMPGYAHLFRDIRGPDLVAYLCSLGADTLPARVRQAQSWKLATPDGTAAAGRRIFSRTCSPCHGPDGAGDGPLSAELGDPAISLRDGPFRFALGPDKRQALARIVKFGIPGLAMAGHEYLRDQDISDIVAYLLSIEPTHAP